MPDPSASTEPEYQSAYPGIPHPPAIATSAIGQLNDQQDLTAALIHSYLQLPSELPANFPDVEIPQFLYGDRLCWISDGEVTDWGIVIGRFYSFAPHCDHWRWCYLIWLDPDSPSSAWVKADIGWEDDLGPMEGEEIL